MAGPNDTYSNNSIPGLVITFVTSICFPYSHWSTVKSMHRLKYSSLNPVGVDSLCVTISENNKCDIIIAIEIYTYQCAYLINLLVHETYRILGIICGRKLS